MTLRRSDRSQILAYRLDSHHLTHRLPLEAFQTAAGACALQNTPPGSAALSLHARLTGLTPEFVDHALTVSKALLQAWSLRASPFIFPTCDHRVFTLGLLPENEEAIRFFVWGVKPALEKLNLRAGLLLQLGADALTAILDGRPLIKDEIGIALADHIAPHLTLPQRESWGSVSGYAPGQTLGESVMRFILPVLALQGLCCHAERRGNQAFIRRTDQWLTGVETSHLPERLTSDQARAELVRRYLHCFGPSTPQHFGEWAGIALPQARRSWQHIQDELVEVNAPVGVSTSTHGPDRWQRAWLHGTDLPRFEAPPQPAGVRFLPPHDPYAQLRDRETLIPNKSIHRLVWRTAGSPGVILWNGEAVASWFGNKQGKRLVLTVVPFVSPPASFSADLEAEADALASIKGCTEATISCGTHP